MCGIIGYAGHRPAVPVVIEGLRRLEYRGYDSAGVAYALGNSLHVVRAAGKLAALEEKLVLEPCSTAATSAMGHTRWATHGAPEERNAHPHRSNDESLAVVHNGIIENYQDLKQKLSSKGYVFHSETDTEVLVNLIAEHRASTSDLLSALAAALREARGAYAVCLMDRNEPGVLYAARMSAPLILGLGTGENFVASDIPAFLPYTRQVVFLEEGDVLRITTSGYEIRNLDDPHPLSRAPQTIQWDMQAAQKGGYRHFMLKEIFEQPRVLTDGLAGRKTDSGTVSLPELDALPVPRRLRIVACGTSLHAGLWGRHALEQWAHIPVQVEIASEFRYQETALVEKDCMTLVISQSGETADTLAALRLAKTRGDTVLGLCNVVGSSIAREATAVLYTQAGPEISVASTKAMLSQMLMLTLMALYWGCRNQSISAEACRDVLATLERLPAILHAALPGMRDRAKTLAKTYANARNFFFLGRGHCYPLALEGALKLKELSYIHAEGYASGEMKHGPIALVDTAFPSFVLALDDALLPKVRSNMVEVEARQGRVIALTNEGVECSSEDVWIIPHLPAPLSGFLVLPALQLFSYETADYLGKDVDQPRNLAKSVTVE